MSYINDALRKAQGERESHYEQFSGIIAPCQGEPARPRKRRFLISAMAVVILLVTACLLMAIYIHRHSFSLGKGSGPSQPVISIGAATARSVVPPAVRPETAPPIPRADQAATPERVSKTSSEAEAAYRGAISAQRKGDIQGAETLYRKTLTLAPGHVQALNNLGVL